ncbi:hypothetical protein CQR44_1121 [Bifidobacterium asteroides]|uniref:Uncharacterized protein n=1 Tax=Bifidobacterium asteroides TaxID=1684 RepID=A0A2N3RAR0_9BIFI|nr:hypothetical protein CQR44_1121 [Bifidobacterium asteroides]
MRKTNIIHNPAIGLVISLILCLACGLMSNLAQTMEDALPRRRYRLNRPQATD